MSSETLSMDSHLLNYLRENSVRETAQMIALREETSQMAEANMQISAEQGQLMSLLVRIAGAEKIIEIGTFTGYSAMWMATALPEHGRIIACDVSVPWTDIASRHWGAAGLLDKIELRLAPALETLAQLRAEGQSGTFDFVFIDAIKTEYDGYYEASLDLLRRGGIVAIDNVLWSGTVADPSVDDEAAVALRELNEKLADDDRIHMAMLPIGDGLTVARKRD
jgi:predicted O-methyltransferase YrrM